VDSTLNVELIRRVGVISLASPDTLNALNPTMVDLLRSTLRGLDRDPGVGAIVLRGEGKHFCAGGDISTFERALAGGRDYVYDVIGLCRQIEHARRPVIAAVHGYALGGGFELALACDQIIAADSARFAVPELSVGAVPGFALVRLSEVAGRQFAKHLAWSGTRIDATTALARGVVTEVVSEAELQAHALDRAATLAALPRVAAETVKALANAAVADRALLESVTSSALMWGTQGLAEGRAAFFEKRDPSFPAE
jgi:enoyl-CoA hydratase/carnithine racemase